MTGNTGFLHCSLAIVNNCFHEFFWLQQKIFKNFFSLKYESSFWELLWLKSDLHLVDYSADYNWIQSWPCPSDHNNWKERSPEFTFTSLLECGVGLNKLEREERSSFNSLCFRFAFHARSAGFSFSCLLLSFRLTSLVLLLPIYSW